MGPLEPTLLDRFASNPSHLLVVVIIGIVSSTVTEFIKAMMFSKRRKEDAEARDAMRCRWNEPNQDWQRKFECLADCDSEPRIKK